MNNAHPAQRVIDAVSADGTISQLRAKLEQLDAQLIETKRAIDDDLAVIRAHTGGTPAGVVTADGALDVEALVRPTRNVESLWERVRKQRAAETEISEGLRVVRRVLAQREDASYYLAFAQHLLPAQVELGGRSVDAMLAVAEVAVEEQTLRAPLKRVSRFEKSDVWAVHTIHGGAIRDQIERLQRHGYRPPPAQLRRLEAIERWETQ